MVAVEEHFLEVSYPILGVMFYLFTLWAFWPSPNHPRGEYRVSKSILKPIIIIHNLVLLVFSAAVFLKTFPYLYTSLQTMDFYTFLLNSYSGKDYEYFHLWSWLFYMSKFYEFADTWIILAKGGRPIMLQIFHHCGAVISMWTLVVTRAPCSWIFVVFNSFIHTVMYFYYTLTTLKFRPPWKSIVTYLQITQFVVGLTISAYYLTTTGALNAHQSAALSFNQSYVSVVLYMFCQFAYDTYFAKSKKKAVPNKAKKHEA